MAQLTTQTLYLSANHTLTEIPNGFALPITTYLGQALYATVSVNNALTVMIDVNALLNQSRNLSSGMSYTQALTAYLTTHSDFSAFLVNFLPKQDAKTAQYLNRLVTFDPRSETGWSVNIGDIRMPDVISDLNRVGTLDDLILTAPAGTVLKNILVSVNGIFHRTVVNGTSLYVIDGFATIRQTGYGAIAACDTTSIGGHTCVPITADMIKYPTGELGYAVITSPLFTLTSATPIISVDGYLQVFCSTYSINDANSLTLHTNQIDYINNYLSSPAQRYQKDYWSVNNQSSQTDPNPEVSTTTITADRADSGLYQFADGSTSVPVDALNSLAFLTSRLSSNHSFVILLNNTHLYTRRYPLVNQGEPLIYEAFGDDMPRGLLFYKSGFVLPYTTLYNKQTNQQLICIDQADQRRPLYHTGVDNPSYPSYRTDWIDPKYIPDAYMIEIYGGALTS